MTTIIRVCCDKCEGVIPIETYGSVTDARSTAYRDGWRYQYDNEHGDIDLCPVCADIDDNYWTREPF